MVLYDELGRIFLYLYYSFIYNVNKFDAQNTLELVIVGVNNARPPATGRSHIEPLSVRDGNLAQPWLFITHIVRVTR